MKSKLIRMLALCLSLLLVLGGCSTGTNSSSDTSSNTSTENVSAEGGAKGRYVEETLTLPDGLQTIAQFGQLGEQHFRLLGNKTAGEHTAPWFLWDSKDGGSTWESVAAPWLDSLDSSSVESIYFVDEETAYLLHSPYSDEIDAQMKKFEEAEDSDGAYAFYQSLTQFSKTVDGQLVPMEYIPSNSQGGGPSQNFVVKDDALFASFYFTLSAFDLATGEERFSIDPGGMLPAGSYLLREDDIVIAAPNTLTFYNQETGEQTNQLTMDGTAVSELNQDGSKMFSSNMGAGSLPIVNPVTNELYYLDATGLFHVVNNGEIIERLLDGSLTSLGLPSIEIAKAFSTGSDSFLVLGKQEESFKLFRYSYDPDVPAAPSKELTIYSLESNLTIQQAIGMFQLANPDIKVTHQIGMVDKSSVTPQDALRNLSTEILAGKGPDLLVLDGMPIESYIEKGILADLTDLFSESMTNGEFLPTIAKTYQKENGLFAIPARFSMYLALGNNLGQFTSLSELTAWAKEDPSTRLGLFKEEISVLFPLLLSGWFEKDGTFNEAAFTQGLDDIEELVNMVGSMEEEGFTVDGDLMMGSVLWKYDEIRVAIAEITEFAGFQYPYSVMKYKETGTLQPFSLADEQKYTPKSILGINSQTKQMEIAQDFLTFALSADVLSYSHFDGFPIHVEALERSKESPYLSENDDGMSFAFSRATTMVNPDEAEGEGEEMDYSESATYEMSVNWPTPEEIELATAMIYSAQTPTYENVVVKRIIADELIDWILEEKQTKEQAKANVLEKLTIYLSE